MHISRHSESYHLAVLMGMLNEVICVACLAQCLECGKYLVVHDSFICGYMGMTVGMGVNLGLMYVLLSALVCVGIPVILYQHIFVEWFCAGCWKYN